jgi:putative tricarboxylic transport membrane protein
MSNALVRCIALTLCLLGSGAVAQSPAWKPSKSIDLIVPSGAGSAVDLTGRQLQQFLQAMKLGDVSVSNRAGGGGAVGWSFMNTHAGDAHYVALTLGNLVSNQITGAHPLGPADVTPLALLFTDYIVFTTKTDSPLRTGADLVARLRKDPASVSFGIPTGLGGLSHTVTAAVLKQAGVDVRKLKLVVFKGAAEASTALLGGHVDMVVSAIPAVLPHIRSGAARGLAICAPQRMSGPAADIPTWKEQGYDRIVSNWRGVVGPRGLTPAQVAWWEDVLAKISQSDDWKAVVEKSIAQPSFMRSAEFRRFLDDESKELRVVLGELGLAK